MTYAGGLPSVEEAVLLLSLMLKRSGRVRARISERLLKSVCARQRLHATFQSEITNKLEQLGVLIVPLDRGGFALMKTSALEGAPPITSLRLIRKEINDSDNGKIDLGKIYAELEIERPARGDDDD